MGYPCSILLTDQHGQNTELLSSTHGSPYTDLNRLEKNFGSAFFAFRAVQMMPHNFKKNLYQTFDMLYVLLSAYLIFETGPLC